MAKLKTAQLELKQVLFTAAGIWFDPPGLNEFIYCYFFAVILLINGFTLRICSSIFMSAVFLCLGMLKHLCLEAPAHLRLRHSGSLLSGQRPADLS